LDERQEKFTTASYVAIPLLVDPDGSDTYMAETYTQAVDDENFRYWRIGFDGWTATEVVYDSERDEFLDPD